MNISRGEAELKTCTRCRRRKPLAEFWKRRARGREGLQAKCKSCMTEEHRRRYGHGRRRINPDVKLRARLKAYGLTIPDHTRMLAEQGDVCAICGNPDRYGRELSVDHDAATKTVRGLLCGDCNRALGLFFHDSDRLRFALNYLRRASFVRP